MLDRFMMNGYIWRVREVEPSSHYLTDRTGERTVATTDPSTHTVYLSSELHGQFMRRVFIHELGHCMLVSYHLLDDIEKMVRPEYRVLCEEWICNLFADYGKMIFDTAYEVLGDDAIHVVPYELDKMIS